LRVAKTRYCSITEIVTIMLFIAIFVLFFSAVLGERRYEIEDSQSAYYDALDHADRQKSMMRRYQPNPARFLDERERSYDDDRGRGQQLQPELAPIKGPEESRFMEVSKNEALDAPYRQIKSDIVSKSNEIKKEGAWIEEVEKVMKVYGTKVSNVKKNILNMRGQVKELLKKKRQIQNLKLQDQLTKKLADAKSDMGTITQAITHVDAKKNDFSRTKDNLMGTINNLKKALKDLRGESGEDDKDKDKDKDKEKEDKDKDDDEEKKEEDSLF